MKTLRAVIVMMLAAGTALADESFEQEWRREQFATHLAAFTAWKPQALAPIPALSELSPDPREVSDFLAHVEPDPRSQFALGVVLLQSGWPREAIAPFALAEHEAELARRARTLRGCALVLSGQHRAALRAFKSLPDDAPCRWAEDQAWVAPVRSWRAVARLGLGDAQAARRLIGRSDPCLDGDVLELEGDFAAAIARWREGGCASRLDDAASQRDPLDQLISRGERDWDAEPSFGAALAAAALGDVEGARWELDSAAASCGRPGRWTPNCLRLARIESELTPLLSRLEAAAALRARPLAPPPFTVQEVPANLRSAEPGALEDLRLDPASIPAALHDWAIVRIHRDGNAVTAISSGRLRPGLDSLPSYRLHVSRDGGVHFDEPLCLGFGASAPWMVRSRSELPLVADGILQPEALSCPSPQIEGAWDARRGTGSQWRCRDEAGCAVLSLALADIVRDTDGDGLTDLQEGWWFLDPRSRDTDGDTVADGRDPSPRTPPTSARPELGPLLEWFVSDAMTVQPPADEGPEATPSAMPRFRLIPESPLQEPLFVVQIVPLPIFHQHWMGGAVPPSTPPSSGTRILALSESEAASRGVFRAGDGSVRVKVLLNRDGSRALLEVNRGDEGGTYLAERGASGWSVRCVGAWVS